MVGDYFKADSPELDFTDDATELITWLRSKTFLLALIREAQTAAGGPTKAVIRAVLTWWTTHLRAFERLLELRPILMSIITADRIRREGSQIITGDRAAKTKAEKMITLIMDTPRLWTALLR